MKGICPTGLLWIAVVTAFLTIGPAHHAAAAKQKKPDITLTSKAATVTVTLDPAIRANDKLAAYLLANGRKWANGNLAEANKEHKESPELFSRGRSWEFERNYTVQSTVAKRFISILLAEYTSTSGAHPNRSFDTILWDDQTKKPISIRPFFTELNDDGPAMNAILKAVIESLVAAKKERDTYFADDLSWQKYIEPKLLKIGPVQLAPSTEAGKSAGLEFQYAPYAVGAYAEGTYQAFVPWTVLKPYLSPEGTSIFGGERPAGRGKQEE